MTSEALYEFLMLSGTLNYTKAAKKLFMTQSALSRHIDALERELNTELFIRSTHSVRLTESGNILLQLAPELIRKLDSAVAALRSTNNQAEGSVTIAISESCNSGIIFDFLRQFSVKYRQIDLTIMVISDEEKASEHLQFDILLSPFEQSGSQLLSSVYNSKLLLTLPVYLALTSEHRLFTAHQIGLGELAGETLIIPHSNDVFGSFASIRQLVERQTRGRVNIVSAPNIQTALLRVALGIGVAVLPQDIANAAMHGVKVIGVNDCGFEVFIYWRKSMSGFAENLLMEELVEYVK
ncbi:MAG: LysR family transcriptional regulator [Oscillospiraceae bacterium]|jgi:DNA-binding transcriptional LysR family regulator|nr:LysR family transcriptional regulator [Oscillospiraceae bacterium]